MQHYAVELAEICIKMLDAQKRYFKTRNRDDLIASKAIEKIAREKANKILLAQQKQEEGEVDHATNDN